MHISDQAARFARTLRGLSEAERPDHFASAVIESGGVYAVPGTGRGFVVLQYLGIQSSGRSEAEAIEAWIRAALPDDGGDPQASAALGVEGSEISDAVRRWDRIGRPLARSGQDQ